MSLVWKNLTTVPESDVFESGPEQFPGSYSIFNVGKTVYALTKGSSTFTHFANTGITGLISRWTGTNGTPTGYFNGLNWLYMDEHPAVVFNDMIFSFVEFNGSLPLVVYQSISPDHSLSVNLSAGESGGQPISSTVSTEGVIFSIYSNNGNTVIVSLLISGNSVTNITESSSFSSALGSFKIFVRGGYLYVLELSQPYITVHKASFSGQTIGTWSVSDTTVPFSSSAILSATSENRIFVMRPLPPRVGDFFDAHIFFGDFDGNGDIVWQPVELVTGGYYIQSSSSMSTDGRYLYTTNGRNIQFIDTQPNSLVPVPPTGISGNFY